MLETLFHKILAKEGAVFAEYAGWKVAMHFGDPAAEHLMVRERLGVCELSHSAKFIARGRDAQDYFHRRLTNNIMRLRPGEGAEACLLQGDGRIIAHLTVYVCDDHLLLITSPRRRQMLLEEFNKFIIMEDCQLEDVSEQYAGIWIQGRDADEFIKRALGADEFPRQLFHHTEIVFLDAPIMMIRISLFGLSGYLLHLPLSIGASAFKNVLREVRAFGGGLFGLQAFHSLRIEAGSPLFGLDYDEECNPLEAGLEHTIDFGKGCFPGQEICAQLKNSGHPSKVLVGVQFDGAKPPAPGTPLAHQGLPAGKITSSAWSPTLERAIALASVLWEYRETGTELQAGDHRAIIVEVPMVKSEEESAPTEPDEG